MLSKAADRYSQALIDLCLELRQTEKVKRELESFLHFFEKSEELKMVLTKAVFSAGQKRGVIEGLCQKTAFSELTRNFLIYLASQNRFPVFPAIYKSFHRKLNEVEGKFFAEISTAVEISQDVKEEFQKKLGLLIGKRMEVTYKTDPALIGGVVTRIGNQIFDGSIKTQLQSWGQALEG